MYTNTSTRSRYTNNSTNNSRHIIHKMHIKNAIVGVTMVGGCNNDMVSLEDAIVVLSSDVCDSRSVASASSQRVKRRRNNVDMEVRPRRGLCWDLNICAVDGEEEEDSLADDDGS